jgi:hypothetical protein
MSEALARWDPPAALPTLRAVMDQARSEFARESPYDDRRRPTLARTIARFTLLRARAGDGAALDEYAAWIRTTTPESLGDARLEAFEPMWAYRDRPASAEASRALFAEPGSRWLALKSARSEHPRFRRSALATSPLIRLKAFRDAVLTALRDTTDWGTLERRQADFYAVAFDQTKEQPANSAWARWATSIGCPSERRSS